MAHQNITGCSVPLMVECWQITRLDRSTDKNRSRSHISSYRVISSFN